MSMASRLFRTSMFRPSAGVSGGRVNWTRLLFRYTEPADRNRLAAIQARFSEVNAQYASVPKNVKPIDWTYWRQNIKTPGIVDQLEAKYNAALANPVKLDVAAQNARDTQAAAEIAVVTEKASTTKEFLEEIDVEIAWTKQYYERPEYIVAGPRLGWNAFALKYGWPHLQIFRINEYLFLERPAQEESHVSAGLRKVDLPQLRAQLKEGNVKALAAVEGVDQALGDFTALQRPFAKKWCRTPNFKLMYKDPNVSVFYRAYALRQFA